VNLTQRRRNAQQQQQQLCMQNYCAYAKRYCDVITFSYSVAICGAVSRFF